mmetsp:Transcript_3248/g.6111  ORF Transcript_3248/g.6111 Transcript_3248/m.6111 type:complete len:653 (-) Transcript_3248:1619-3577(-)
MGRWELREDHKYAVVRQVKSNEAAWQDFVEMSGLRCSMVVHYRVSSTRCDVAIDAYFPQLRVRRGDPRGYSHVRFDGDLVSTGRTVLWGGKPVEWSQWTLVQVLFDGILRFIYVGPREQDRLEKQFFPSRRRALVCQRWVGDPSQMSELVLSPEELLAGICEWKEGSQTVQIYRISGTPGRSSAGAALFGTTNGNVRVAFDIDDEYAERCDFIQHITSRRMVLKSPERMIDVMFGLAKIRATESVFESSLCSTESKRGLVHSPGGGMFYCGVWANDQAEYACPFFPHVIHPHANDLDTILLEAAKNSLITLTRYPGRSLDTVPYSVEIEGEYIGQLDRGDAAMFAYGASEFALRSGDQNFALALLPHIERCLRYVKSRVHPSLGVVISDSDELEGRYPTGSMNLSTSCLSFAAIESTRRLQAALSRKSIDEQDNLQSLCGGIHRYFGTCVRGVDTFAYCDDEPRLRGWICLPLCFGIGLDRTNTTLTALFDESFGLWQREHGISVAAHANDFWDRETLYALRSAFLVGDAEKSLTWLLSFTEARLLGGHVPYALEEESRGAQLSAESALYCRIVIEGMLGYRALDFNRFSLTPNIPHSWNFLRLENFSTQGYVVDVDVTRTGSIAYSVSVTAAQGTQSVDILYPGSVVFSVS